MRRLRACDRLGRQRGQRLSLVGRTLPDGLLVRFIVLQPSSERGYRSSDWHGALVVVEHGAITLITRRERRLTLGRGAVLWLSRLPLRAIANPHADPALLSVLSRRGASARERA